MTRSRTPIRAFYLTVLLLALAGQSLAAREWLGWPLLLAIVAVAAVEFGGVVLSMHADQRRQLGERAAAARILSAAVAAGAVAVNWFGHDDRMQGAFFAGMSALGYLVWLVDTGARRREQLRAARMLPPTPPAYGMQWLRHPSLTARARRLALESPDLGLYGSLAAATAQAKAERRQVALAAALRTKVVDALGDPVMATIATTTFDLDEIARRLAASADYDGLTALLGADLAPARLAGGGQAAVEVVDVETTEIEAPDPWTFAEPVDEDPWEAAERHIQEDSERRRIAQALATPPPTPMEQLERLYPRKAAPTKPRRQPSNADRVAKATARTPEATNAAIAARLGLSERTVSRHRTRPTDDTVTASLNGHAHGEVTP